MTDFVKKMAKGLRESIYINYDLNMFLNSGFNADNPTPVGTIIQVNAHNIIIVKSCIYDEDIKCFQLAFRAPTPEESLMFDIMTV
jgi:hypothetical protein